jgi:hypothetical protein
METPLFMGGPAGHLSSLKKFFVVVRRSEYFTVSDVSARYNNGNMLRIAIFCRVLKLCPY